MKNDKLFCSSELINGKKSDEERKKRKWCCYFYFWLSLDVGEEEKTAE